ncbi:M48 family metallopeptidase [Reinekea thalattae]|uniref:M48 family metallopeptidase n=1 Tax=Reinekea thalattae TaxID=2593301 RepID=A0A5C8ZA30_9GAMM|nr:M48 family metallopeptidase [Reinekea thalattae]TXR53736.1 M48 family metallopeptidase [Reinekea thalattae]
MKVKLFCLFCVAVISGCATSPTGQKQLLFYDRSSMAAKGEQSFEELKQNLEVSRNEAINAYAQCISQAIVSVVPEEYGYAPEEWEVVVFDSEAVNAFALPGAKIGIYTGLIELADNADQLAAVVGHEVGHVLANHSNARLSSQQMTALGLMVAGLALAENENQQAWVAGLGITSQVLLILPYGRSHESEADLIGQELMADAGFDPRQAAQLWVRMSENASSSTPELLSTHPSHDTRISDLQAAQDEYYSRYLQVVEAGQRPNCVKP